MYPESFFRNMGFRTVAGRTYPGTYAVVPAASFKAEQVHNRDSATWKKAEHIVVREIQADRGSSLLYGWHALTNADPDYSHRIQKLYIPVSTDTYLLYDARGNLKGTGTLESVFRISSTL